MFNDASLVAQLVAKLPESGQELWHLDRTTPEAVASRETTGARFLAWLERQGEAANSARIGQQALSLTRQATARNPENRTKTGKAFATVGRPPANQRARAPTIKEPGQQHRNRSPDHILGRNGLRNSSQRKGPRKSEGRRKQERVHSPCDGNHTSTSGGYRGVPSLGQAAGCRTVRHSKP